MCGGIPNSSGDAPATSPLPRALFISLAALLSMFFVTFAGVAALVFRCCRRRAGASSEHTPRAGGSCERDYRPFPVEMVPPAFDYARGPDDDHGSTAARECAVCLGAVQEGEMVRRLPDCGHVYHVECIDRWLAAHRTCPLCRSELDPCKTNSDALPPQPPQEDQPDHQLPV
ncbi:hypothetical protein GQ55_4G123300 [Panicum hallii var. hallii]|uniref:RING-type E3 ubiquitin transferase n=2 Tax=Panicum hallii TaxID=206008 RepID=A0A2T7DXV8_9POAL|nr:RING-H2 finger protein ATL39-like [Panicum hallii]PAN23834.1 hypothetical protein PAHAL_4G122000 [Panicum hallii]PUZ60411.1 hypothetical protein GQ55_4G123300 [Panicum hallii var. hallii]